MNEILNRMGTDDLRKLAESQDDAIRAYQKMVFMKDSVIEALETLYRCRVNMEEARVEYEIKIRNLRRIDDKIAEKYCSTSVVTCEAEG